MGRRLLFTRIATSFAVGLVALIGAAQMACGQSILDEPVARENEPIRPVPLQHDVNQQKAALGEKLFHDTLLSGDNSISCASCHNVSAHGVDGDPTSTGIRGQKGTVNAPTVINSRFNFAQFWDGRAESLEEQAMGPVANPIEMGAVWEDVVAKLNKKNQYKKEFAALYPDGITKENISDAIKAYEYTLTSVNSPFDQYLRGYDDAITQQQKRGYSLFKEYGCVACHQGVNVGGNMYQRMGAFVPYFNDTNLDSKDDLGRYNVTKLEEDLHVFKVPSLRLVAHTAPYFHDGSVETLSEAIDIMARYQLGYTIPEQDKQDIIAFLKSLSGDHPREKK